MDPFVRSMLITWLFIGSAFGVHWAFMRSYSSEKKKQRRGD